MQKVTKCGNGGWGKKGMGGEKRQRNEQEYGKGESAKERSPYL